MRGIDKKKLVWVAEVQFEKEEDVTLRFNACPHRQDILSALAHVQMFAKPYWPFEIISIRQVRKENHENN